MVQQPKTGRRKVSNLMALSLLSLLTERPMYPYEMASKLREYGKDQAIKINWGSLYTVVQNLEKHGFIEAVEVAREGRQPERTTYRITEAGRAELKDWLRELIYRFETEHLLLRDIKLQLSDGNRRLRAECCGEPADWSRHLPDNELKAVTYHGLRVEQIAGGWMAEVILDI